VIDPVFIACLLLLLLCALGLSWFAGTDAPYVPTKAIDLLKILKTAGVKKDINFYELGSGDGRVVLAAANLGANSYGIEQSWLRVWYSRFIAEKKDIPNTHFYHGNIYDREYFPADVVYIYMLQPCIDKLEKKLPKELKKGAVVITQRYHFKKWKPYKKIGNFNLYRAASSG
jgi:SAM-dependent methyltransferase